MQYWCIWSVVDSIASGFGVYWIGTHHRTPFYVILVMGIGQTGLKKRHQTGVWMSCLASQHTWNIWKRPNWPRNSFSMPVGHLFKKITLILMTPDWCRDEMPAGHYFWNSFLCPLDITLKNFEGNTPSFYARLCLALSGFAWLCLALIQALIQAIRLITW